MAFLIPLATLAEPIYRGLSHTKWVVQQATDCPDFFFFGEKKYLLLNYCDAGQTNGVIENGTYSYSSDSIILTRHSRERSGIIEPSPEKIVTLRVISQTAEVMILQLADKTLELHRLFPQSPPEQTSPERDSGQVAI